MEASLALSNDFARLKDDAGWQLKKKPSGMTRIIVLDRVKAVSVGAVIASLRCPGGLVVLQKFLNIVLHICPTTVKISLYIQRGLDHIPTALSRCANDNFREIVLFLPA